MTAWVWSKTAAHLVESLSIVTYVMLKDVEACLQYAGATNKNKRIETPSCTAAGVVLLLIFNMHTLMHMKED